MISVVIPAHNEERVLGRCLTALSSGLGSEAIEAVVVANGCIDRTAEIARSFGWVRVVETDVASKIHAINLGERHASGFPRFYVDADVRLTIDALKTLAAALSVEGTLAVAPRFQMDLTGCSWFVRAFYKINGLLPSAAEGIGGSGVYGLSERGRRRFAEFPRVVADDGFVRIQFAPSERKTLPDCFSTVFAPRCLKDLIRIKARSHFGSAQLRRAYPELWINKGPGNKSALKRMVVKPNLWAQLIVYSLVKVLARIKARRLRQSGSVAWERDDTSRSAILSA